MPIIRKLVCIGKSKGIFLPKSWIENAEKETGKKMVAVTLEINGVITIKPIFEG